MWVLEQIETMAIIHHPKHETWNSYLPKMTEASVYESRVLRFPMFWGPSQTYIALRPANCPLTKCGYHQIKRFLPNNPSRMKSFSASVTPARAS